MRIGPILCAALLATPAAAAPGTSASGGPGEEPRPGIDLVRPVLGIGPAFSDAGLGVAVQLGIRLDHLLMRVAVEGGGGASRRGFLSTQLRADWFVYGQWFCGTGIGDTGYGFIFDSPTASVGMLTPGVGYVARGDKPWGRIILQLTGQVPLGRVARPSDNFGQQIAPPIVVASAILSL